MNPADSTEANSANLVGMWSNPISTDTVCLFLDTFAIMDSKKPIPRPRVTASAKKSAGKQKPEFASRNVAHRPKRL